MPPGIGYGVDDSLMSIQPYDEPLIVPPDPSVQALLNPLIASRRSLADTYQSQLSKFDELNSAAETAQAGGGMTAGQGIASALIAALPLLMAGGNKRKIGVAAPAGVAGVEQYMRLNKEQQAANLQRLLGLSKNQASLLSRTQSQLGGVDKQIAQIGTNAELQKDRLAQQKDIAEMNNATRQMGQQMMAGMANLAHEDRMARLDQEKAEEQRRRAKEANELIDSTLGPVRAMGGELKKFPDGTFKKLKDREIAEIQKVKDASDKAQELENILRPQMQKNGLTINVATEDGRILYNQMRSDLQALFEEVASNSVYSKQGLRPDEIGRLLRRMPADPDEFTSWFRNPAITFTKAEIATLNKLTEQLDRTTRTVAENRGVLLPDKNGVIQGEFVTPDHIQERYQKSYEGKRIATDEPKTKDNSAAIAQAVAELKALREQRQAMEMKKRGR